MNPLSTPQYWSNRYTEGKAGWDNKRPHPQWEKLLQDHPEFFQAKTVAVIGAGPGHDAELFSQSAKQCIALDFSEEALRSFQKYYPNSKVDYRLLDFFDLPLELKADTVLEHTLLCAIDPKDHPRYFHSLRSLVKPDGLYIAIIWNQTSAGDQGPPFSTSNAIVEKNLKDSFIILEKSPVTSTIPGREGTETLFIAQRQ